MRDSAQCPTQLPTNYAPPAVSYDETEDIRDRGKTDRGRRDRGYTGQGKYRTEERRNRGKTRQEKDETGEKTEQGKDRTGERRGKEKMG